MKIIHCADLHLGSSMQTRLSSEKAALRREEICRAFEDTVAFARREGVQAVLLCGDIFDSDCPLLRDRQFFFGVIEQAKEILFFYLKGNHDRALPPPALPNLKTFSAEWTTYDLGEITVSGIELCAQNALSLYSSLTLPSNKRNIVMMHGQVAEVAGENTIAPRFLAGKNIDYLALGHIHFYDEKPLDGRGRYAYSGCLEGRGFDELGDKGFVLIETGAEIKTVFVPRSYRAARLVKLDISGLKSVAETIDRAARIGVAQKDMLRLVLCGEAAFDTEGLENIVYETLKENWFALSVKDETCPALDLAKYRVQVGVEGEFVRLVESVPNADESRKKRILALGLKALSGEKL
ncbi:MAG: DNA repair exonuclease [Clostridia bacterium]|nr:DNA repair exonuclease [Clostridia bacterium]